MVANVEAGNQDLAIASLLETGDASKSRKVVGAAMDAIVEVNVGLAEELYNESTKT